MPPADNGKRRDANRRDGTGDARRKSRRDAVDHARGSLVLIGGACNPLGDALGAFIRLSDARSGAPIVGFTTASSTPERAADLWRKDFADAGVTNVDIPILRSREDACNAEIAARVRNAAGIFLGGGDQVHLIATLSGTAVSEAIREAFVRGATVCGTSAGAAALTETTMAGGEFDEEGKEIEMYIGPGLGLLCFGTLIDTHFAQRRRLHRLFVTIAGYPQLLGLGIDEDTALVVHGEVGEVVGKGGVTFVDGRDTVRYDNASRLTKGGELTLSHLRVGLVGTGHKFDLRLRELVALIRPEDSALASHDSRSDGLAQTASASSEASGRSASPPGESGDSASPAHAD